MECDGGDLECKRCPWGTKEAVTVADEWTNLTGDDEGDIHVEMLQMMGYIKFQDNEGNSVSITEQELARVPFVAALVDENKRLQAAVHAASQGGNVIMPMNTVEKNEFLSTIGELANLSVLMGVDTGLARASVELREAAGRLFANGQDVNALKMRDAAAVVERLRKEHGEADEWVMSRKGALWEAIRGKLGE